MQVDSKILSPYQINQILGVCEDLIEGLDLYAIKELSGGGEKDVDYIFNQLFDVTRKTLYDLPSILNPSNFGYLDKLSENIDEGLKVKSLNYFIVSTFPNYEIELFTIEWANLAQFFDKLVVVAARTIGKSYFFSWAYPIWKMYRYRQGKNPWLNWKENELQKRGILITAEATLSADFLKLIREEIEVNPLLNKRLLEGAKIWGSEEISTGNGASLQAKGIGGSLRGRHPQWCLCDDLLEESNLYSEEQRKKVIDLFFSVIMNMVTLGGDIKVVGTPFHQQDLYAKLKQDKRFRVFEYPAILPDGSLLSPKRLPLSELLYKRESQGKVIFTREILCKPISSDSTIFPWPILEMAYWGMELFTYVRNRQNYPVKIDRICVGVDLAISATIGADFTCMTVWGYCSANMAFYLMYMWREKGKSYLEQINQVKSIYLNFKPDILVIETNSFQEAFAQSVEQEKIPVFRHNTGVAKKDLYFGIPSMALMFEKGQLKLPIADEESKNKSDIVLSEFNSMTFTSTGKLVSSSSHDDTVHSSYLAIKIGFKAVNSKFSYDFI